MTIKWFLIGGTLALVGAVPLAAVLPEAGADLRSGVTSATATVGDLASRIGVAEVSAPAAETNTLRPSLAPAGQVPSQKAAAQPWDSPDWEAKVAEKLLEKLVQLPEDPGGTGALGPVSEPAPDLGTASTTARAEPWPTPPEPAEPALIPSAPSLPRIPEAAPPSSVLAGLPQAVVPPPIAEDPAAGEMPDPAAPLPPVRPKTGKDARDGAPPTGNERQRKEAARQFAVAYLESWSAETGEALAALDRMSAQRIDYFGHSISKRAWLEKKRDFARTWPARVYRHRSGTLTVECAGNTERCTARSTVDWETVSPKRGDFAQGVSRLELGIDLSGGKPKILGESNLRVHTRRNLPKERPDSQPVRSAPEYPVEAMVQ